MSALRRVGAFSDRVVSAMPDWMRSIRLRLALLYSLVLFGLAGLVVGVLYVGVSSSLRDQPVSRQIEVGSRVFRDPFGKPIEVGPFVLADIKAFERTVNERTLEQLAKYSVWALGGLFVASLGVGWVIAGRVLRPIARITSVARDIQASDLSRRIALAGPRDELRELADTFDGMLARLDAAFAAQRRFIADASHELRNPLAVMRTNLELAVADPNADPEEVQRLVAAARRSAERMSRMVEDLLLLARQDSPSTQIEEFDLSLAADEVVEEHTAAARERGLRLERSGCGTLRVTGDPDAVRRAVANVVDNAVRLAPAGSTVEVSTGTNDGWAFASVADEGPGIAQEDRVRIFDRFWRADAARTRARGGTGLGLAIVRQIVEAHGGQVMLDSEPGRGSVFTLRMPARESAEEPRGDTA